jgi:hypothetical protein
MIRRLTAYIVLLCLLPPALTWSQDPQRPDVTVQPADTIRLRNSAGILFDRNLNTFTWIGRAAVDTTAGGTHVNFNELYSSNVVLVSTPGGGKLQSNQQSLSLRLSHRLVDNLFSTAQWSSMIYSDNRSVALGNASINSVLGGVNYLPFQSISLSPMAGYRWDKQADVRDRGPSYQLGGRATDLDLDGYLFNAAGQYHTDNLNPRRLESHFGRVSIQKQFTPSAEDSVEVGAARNRREFYISGDSTIESRVENIFSFSNLLSYEILPRVAASFYFGFNTRGLDKNLRNLGAPPPPGQFNTHIDESHLDAFFQTDYRSRDGLTGASFRFAYSERDEMHAIRLSDASVPKLYAEANAQEESKNNISRQTSVAGSLDFPFSLSDHIFLSAAARILRYDTPSLLNVEDRDELLVVASIGTRHHVSRYLDMDVVLDGTLSHLVYLLSDRSANNNINRVLRLSPRATYRPSPYFMTMNAFEVLANYTVYDFEQQVALVKSFSFRQFGWIDSSSIQITRKLGLDFFAYLKLYERGQLKWTEFRERTENSFIEKTYVVQVRFSPNPGLLFAVGLRFFSQSRYAYKPQGKLLDLYLRSAGPTCLINWQVGPHSQINLRGWYEERRQTDGSIQGLTNMTMNILMNF